MSDREQRQFTKLVEGGRRKEWRRRLVNVPVERASTILFDSVAELHSSKPGLGSYRYGLQGTATQWALAEALTELEPGAAGTALYSTGLAAITAPLLALLSPGDELLAPERGLVTLLDNTWATPLFFPAIAAGVDVTILAATKYVGGHADVMLGSATATEEYFQR